MKQIGNIEDGLASQARIKSKGETQLKQIGRVVAFNHPDAELTSGPINPNEDNDLLREEILDEVEKGETQLKQIGRAVAFNPPDAELMSGPLQPHEDNDLVREEILDEVEKGESDEHI
ncbi:MAG: hypothetical protein ABSF14_23905 [Terriglobia bacterium]|jgi:hypothetical protein